MSYRCQCIPGCECGFDRARSAVDFPVHPMVDRMNILYARDFPMTLKEMEDLGWFTEPDGLVDEEAGDITGWDVVYWHAPVEPTFTLLHEANSQALLTLMKTTRAGSSSLLFNLSPLSPWGTRESEP